jgi:hypothetical protein
MFKLTAPSKPRAANWDVIAEAAIHSAISLAERGVIDGEDRHRIADAIAHRILRKETNSTTDGGALVDRAFHDLLGGKGYARRVLDCSSTADWDKLREITAAKTVSTLKTAEWFRFAERIAQAIERSVNANRGEVSEFDYNVAETKQFVDRLLQDLEEAQQSGEAADEREAANKEQGIDGNFGVRSSHSGKWFTYTDAFTTPTMQRFADRLRGRAKVGERRDDEGNIVRGRSLAQWTAGAYRTPLGLRTPAPAKLAVSILGDLSGSTSSGGIDRAIWDSVSTLAKAVEESGNLVAVEAWGDKVPWSDNAPLIAWGEAVRNIRTDSGTKFEGTHMARSAEPLMGRLQATAPSGVQHIAIIVTDGATDAKDRAEFLRKAGCPCIYWVVSADLSSAKAIAPSADEGWAAVVTSGVESALDVALGETMLGVLIGA